MFSHRLSSRCIRSLNKSWHVVHGSWCNSAWNSGIHSKASMIIKITVAIVSNSKKNVILSKWGRWGWEHPQVDLMAVLITAPTLRHQQAWFSGTPEVKCLDIRSPPQVDLHLLHIAQVQLCSYWEILPRACRPREESCRHVPLSVVFAYWYLISSTHETETNLKYIIIDRKLRPNGLKKIRQRPSIQQVDSRQQTLAIINLIVHFTN